MSILRDITATLGSEDQARSWLQNIVAVWDDISADDVAHGIHHSKYWDAVANAAISLVYFVDIDGIIEYTILSFGDGELKPEIEKFSNRVDEWRDVKAWLAGKASATLRVGTATIRQVQLNCQ